MKPLYLFIDESGTDEKAGLLCMTLVATEDPDSIRESCRDLIEKIKLDPELSSNIESIRERGIEHFHYTSDHFEVRRMFIELLPNLNFDAYTLFVRKEELTKDISKTDLLVKLFSRLLYPRIQEKHCCDIFVVYERFDEGSLSDESAFKLEADQLCRRIKAESGIEVGPVKLSFDGKSEQCLGIADYLCGIISSYITKKLVGGSVKDSCEERDFNRVSGKIRLINDFTRSKFYSRKGDLFDIEAL